MSDPQHAPLSPQELRRFGYDMVDLIAEYWESLQARPVLCPLKPGDVSRQLPPHPPANPEPFETVLRDVNAIILPGLTNWQSPSFFGYFPANASVPAVLGELLSAGLGVNGMLWSTSPACTELETRVLDWLAEMIALPDSFRSTTPNAGGVIQGTASEAVLVALLAARHRYQHQHPSAHPHYTLYTSTQAHSSVVKAAMIAGLAKGPDDRSHLRLIHAGADYAMRPDLLQRAIREDRSAGKTPIFVCATLGTTSSTASDPIDIIGPLARLYNLWLHIDAAYAGAACVCPEFRTMLEGVEHADSFGFNPHKWLLTNFDCAALWTSDRASLTGALSITPEYLRNPASDAGQAIDYRDWQVPLGRRFRALKLWMVIRHFGVSGLQAHIREHVRLAALFEKFVAEDDRFEIPAPRTLGLVCFRLRNLNTQSLDTLNALNRDLLARVNSTGKAFLTHTVLPGTTQDHDLGIVAAGPGHYTLRMAIGSSTTTEPHVRAAWDLIKTTADQVC